MRGIEHRRSYTPEEIAGGPRGVGIASGELALTEELSGILRPSKSVEHVSANGSSRNLLLTTLPDEVLARLLPHLERVALRAGADVYGAKAEANLAYFPESAVVTQLHFFSDGAVVEAAMFGREGLVGLSTILDSTPPWRWMRILIPGDAFRVRVEVLNDEFGRGEALQQLLLAYTSERLSQLSQRAVCNGRHKVEERFCTWLLMVHDRAEHDELPLTHELIARCLGARRAGVTHIAHALRQQGVIAYSRGRVRITARRALESAACECYPALRLR